MLIYLRFLLTWFLVGLISLAILFSNEETTASRCLCNTGLRKQRALEGLLVLIKLGDGGYLPEVLGLVDCAFL